MLEDNYSEQLTRLLETCECDIAVPGEWQERMTRRGVIPSVQGDRRQFVRHYFHARVVLEFKQTLPAIPRRHTIVQAMTGDLSRAGIAFLHSDQLFPGERVSLWLSRGKRSFIVVRCVQRNENCFEIGAVVADKD
jgi:hypothetical protein